MKNDAVWQAFRETGDPVCYLLYKTMERKENGQRQSAPAGS